MSPPAGHPPRDAEALGASCATCSDAAEPMRVLACDGPAELALCVGDAGRRVQVDLGILGGARIGDVLLVHAGTALAKERP